MFYNAENFTGKGLKEWKPKGWQMTDMLFNTKVKKNNAPDWIPF